MGSTFVMWKRYALSIQGQNEVVLLRAGALLKRRHARLSETKVSGNLKGDGSQAFVVAMLAELTHRSFTGLFQLGTRKTLRRVFFIGGRPVGFWSDHPEDAFGRRFVDAGILDSEALRWAQQHLADAERIEEALVNGTVVTWQQVAEQQQRHIEAGLDALVRAKSGSWEVRSRPALQEKTRASQFPEGCLFSSTWKGIRRSVSADQAVGWISGGGGAFRCEAFLERVCADLGDVPDGLVEGLKEGMTLEQLFDRVKDPSGELFQLVWFLECSGAISRLGGVDRTDVCAQLDELSKASQEQGKRKSVKPQRRRKAPAKAARTKPDATPQTVSPQNQTPEDIPTASVPRPGVQKEQGRIEVEEFADGVEGDVSTLGKGQDEPVVAWAEKDVPNNLELSYGRAAELMQIGAFAAALSFLEEARFAEPNNPSILADLGWAHFKVSGGEDFQEAEDYVGLALTFDANHPKALEYAGRLALEKGEMEKAMGHIQRLASVDPKNRWAKAQMRQLGTAKTSKRGFGFWRRK